MRKSLQKKMVAWLLAIAVLVGGCSGGYGNSTEDIQTSGTTEEMTAGESEEPEKTSEELTEELTETESATGGEEPTESESTAGSDKPTETEPATEGEEPTEAEPATDPEAPTEPALSYYIKVSRTENVVMIYGKDASGAYTVLKKTMVCSVGTGRRTPVGTFAISDQYRWRALFSNSYGQYASRITGHILFHSVPYYAQSQDALITETYDDLGSKASLGCVRLKTIDAKWIYDNCPPGTPVEIYDGDVPEGVEKPESLSVNLNSPYKGWDPTDPDPNNPWKTVPITMKGITDLTVECGSELDLLSHVSAWDIDGKSPLTVLVSGKIDVNVCGTYTVTYSAVGAIGTTASVRATVTVVPVPVPETEAPTEEETSTETDVPTEEETSTETEAPTEEETSTETEAPTEEETSAETEEPTEEETGTPEEMSTEESSESQTDEKNAPEDESSEER